MQDAIVREITLKAPKERVYAAVADPKEVTKWFPDKVDGDYTQGGRPVFDFGSDGTNQVYIEAAQPYEYFAFRWIPGSNHFIGDVLTQSNTLVEFRIEEMGEETKLTLTESGFASLAYDNAEERLSDNNGGWDYMMDRLGKVFA